MGHQVQPRNKWRALPSKNQTGFIAYHAQEVLGLLQQLAGKHDDKVGAVANLVFLLLRGQDQHLGCGVLDLSEEGRKKR